MDALASSVGKKFVMAITGFLLCGFLAAHLAGNLLLYVGAEEYNGYAHKLHSQEELIKIAEVGLILLFGAHIALAFRTSRDNKSARSVPYQMKVSKIENPDSPVRAETWMFVSGAMVLGFVLLHLADFTFMVRPDIDYSILEGQEYQKAITILKTPISLAIYIVGCIVLWCHLSHGVASAFQSLGINHPKYNGLIKWGSRLFAAIIGIGFLSFPIWAIFQK